MESGGPSAILGPLERLGQGRARNGKRPPSKERGPREHNEELPATGGEVRPEPCEGESPKNIDIRI
jgi:hypothetical protein